MTSTPPENTIGISDSWVDLTTGSGLSASSGPASPVRVTPVPFGGEGDYIRMLREAQRESSRSSNKVSPISSAIMSLSSTTRNTPSASPKSPPNSPNPELATFAEDMKGVYINRSVDPASGSTATAELQGQPVTASELLWDWTSKPVVPHKEWTFRSRKSSTSSKLSLSNHSSGGEDKKKKLVPGRYSRGVLLTIILTNIISFFLGAGIGMWISRRGGNEIIEVGV